MERLTGKRILIMATDGFEESELFGPRDLLRDAGAMVQLASPTITPIQATVMDDPGRTIRPDLAIDQVDAGAFDALVLPGGVRSPDSLRLHPGAVDLIRKFHSAAKPIAAICHGPWLLVEADIVRGRTVACWPSIATDLRNAGADVVDQAAVVDGNIVTSRKPADVPAFTEALAGLLTDQV
ncbi:MAG TPA: type 1 glutamine amidotransferase domain-containing protein [Sphingomicrobium sp.]|nr:type 1 glutamine amidotransferase domain-containing protein [Sphingomicrobium sp.]